MMTLRTVRLVVVTAFSGMALAASAGPTFDLAEDTYLKIGILGQVHGAYTDGAADEEDIYLRRGRLILSGQIIDGVKFFVETDNDNAGKSGTSGVSTDIQDAFIDIRLAENHWVEVGLVLLPFSFETMSSAASLLGLDYNSEVIKLVNTFVWRDNGAELHGSLGKRFAYRVGAFDGYDDTASSKNPEAPLRVTGHLALNLIGEVQTGWFYSQERLADKPYLTVGVGADYQEKATRTVLAEGEPDRITDNEAYVLDFQSGWAIGPVAATLNGGWYIWDNAVFDGDTGFAEAGLRYNQMQLTGKLSIQDPDEGDATQDTTVGFNYFMSSHNARCGVEVRTGDSPDQVLLGLQFML